MRKIIKILNVPIDQVTMKEAVDKVLSFFEGNKLHTVFTPNPEIIMEAKRNSSLFRILNEADLIVPDGIGVVIGSRFQKNSLPERVAGYDLVQNVFMNMASTNKTVYFFGGKPGVAEKAKDKMEEKYPGLKIVGCKNGYYKPNEEKLIIEDIIEKSPDLLLIGFGAPKQEMWIDSHKHELNAKVVIGVGGSFDVMAGVVKRAPRLFQRLGLEWFYRLLTQPTRARRMLQLPIFMLHVVGERFIAGKDK